MWDIVADAMQLAVSLAELTFYVEYVERRREDKKWNQEFIANFFFWWELDCVTAEKRIKSNDCYRLIIRRCLKLIISQ